MQLTKTKRTTSAAATLAAGKAAPTVFEVMTREVATAFPEMTLASAIGALVAQDIGHLPVVNQKGVLVGMLSKSDVVREQHLAAGNSEQVAPGNRLQARGKKGLAYEPGNGFHADADGDTTVADVMTQRVLSVRADASLPEVCRMLVGNRIHGMPVVDARDKLVGFVSTLDVCEWVANH